MLVIVNTETGEKIETVRGVACWPDGAVTHAPKAGLQRGPFRIVGVVEDVAGDGPLVETVGEAFDGENWVVSKVRSHPPLEDLKAAKKEVVAQRRWEVETAGLAVGGVLVATDRESQALITGKQLYLDKVPTATEVRWKAESGWVTIPRAQFEQIAVAVAEHVQACFDREGELADEIDAVPEEDDAAARTALDAIDVEAFWPVE